ncbi:hypothetical protein F5Y07DRAFT_401094 [Xylaria sp. FL0933]|nr:hypothetical protein F5Y07DRAFT_401094 [Xylaria sp. FL0933]
MTSKDTQQPATPASNNTAAPAATSYASAAGAVKKPSSTPVVATGSNQPVVAAGSSAPTPNHAKSSSVSPMNGRPSIMPAVPVPTVAHGTSTLNGQSDHNRKSSVTISTNGPNNYPTNGASTGGKPGIQFGYQDSPAVSHSTPQPPTAPVPIPTSRTVMEPRSSPSPIPPPSISGGRPSSGAALSNANVAFGSFDNDQSHMRTPSASQDPSALGPQHSPHMRRGSNVSDISAHGPQPGGMGRGNFGGGRGGRAYSGGYNAGYPPNNFNRNQQGNQGRGGMPPSFPNNGRQHGFGTPPQQNRSPAMAAAVPQGVPPMPPPPYYYNQASVGPNQVHHQTVPSSSQQLLERTQSKHKKKGIRRDSEKFSNIYRRPEPFRHDYDVRQRRFSRRLDSRISMIDEQRPVGQILVDRIDSSLASDSPMISLSQNFPMHPQTTQEMGHIDLSPESGNFDRLLTSVKQNYYQGPYDHRNTMPPMQPMQPMQPVHGFPAYPNMHGGGSPLPHYQQPFVQNPYPPTHQPMSRSNSSQISEQRPASSTGQSQVPVAQGTPQQQAAQLKPVVAQSPHFTRPTKRNAAITIKNEAGEAIDLKNLKPPTPASPAPTSQQSRTPPVISSTPTPPPKTSTPKSFVSAHSRTDSTSNSKTVEEKRNEFREKIKQTASGDKDKEDGETKASTEKTVPESLPTNTSAQDEPKLVENKDNEANDEKTAQNETKQAAVAEPSTPKASDAPPNDGPPEEDDLERVIREMEEADAKREKEEEERRIKKQAENAAKKKAEEEARIANAAENDRKLREQEREMERLEEEKERKRAAAQGSTESAAELLKKSAASADVDVKEAASTVSEAAGKLAGLSLNDKTSSGLGAKASPSGTRAPKPQALNLAPLNTKTVEPPQPSAALQSLKTARILDVIRTDIYPPGINSPNPALNAAVTKKGTSFKYDPAFLLQFKTVYTELPSVDFHQQVKTLIGDGDGGRSASNRSGGGSGRQSTRGSTSSFPMGSFGAGGVSQLPPGSTSTQRFEMSNKAMGGRPSAGVNLGSFQRPGGAFAGGNPMSRTPSSNMGSMAHSSRQTSRRNASKPNTVNAKSEAQAAKSMPLTAGMKIETLQISSTGWKPTSVGKATPSGSSGGNLMDPAMVQRKVKAALNKMTPENFDRISDQILEIAAQSKEETDGRTLRQVIQLTFEKATDEAHWASMYAKFCKKMLETMSPDIRDESIKDRNGNVVNGGALFRKYLLNRCQEEFERGWKLQLPEPKEGDDKKAAAAVLLSDEYYQAAAAKRRGLGLVQFIGELYKLGMLTERIMHECVRKLVDYSGIPDEAEVESLCKLLRTIGGNLDAAEKGKPMMDAYFQRIQSMIDLPGLPSRLQFMLMDVVDLRKANWVSKEANKGPKTLEEVRAEAEALAAQKAAEAARSNQRGGGGRAQLGRGDARHMPGGFPQPVPNQVGIDDLRRLKGGASRPSSTNITLGPMSMLTSRSNSGRRLGPGGSLSRGADDSGASSRTGTPPVRETPTSTNSFGLLANMDSEHPGSPPSTAASPALAKATPETSAVNEKGGN